MKKEARRKLEQVFKAGWEVTTWGWVGRKPEVHQRWEEQPEQGRNCMEDGDSATPGGPRRGSGTEGCRPGLLGVILPP